MDSHLGGAVKYKHLIDISDLNAKQCHEILECAESTKTSASSALQGKSVALIFEKPSLRTRHSMERAISQLGGQPIYVQKEEISLGQRETVEDVTNVLARYHSFICARVFDHAHVEQMAQCNVAPVINLLSDRSHPLQALADIITINAEFETLKGKKVAYIGDANNVARSLGQIVKMFDMEFTIASPADYSLSDNDREAINQIGEIDLETDDPIKAATGADVVYTDTWVSMGDETEAEKRLQDFSGYCVTQELMSHANDDAIFMHCLPAHRGQEVATDVIDSQLSRVFDQAENRMHSARGLLDFLSRRV